MKVKERKIYEKSVESDLEMRNEEEKSYCLVSGESEHRRQGRHSLAHTCNLKQIFDLITDSAHEMETERKEREAASAPSEAVYVGGGCPSTAKTARVHCSSALYCL